MGHPARPRRCRRRRPRRSRPGTLVMALHNALAAFYGHIRLGPMTGGAKRGLLYLIVLTLVLVGGAYIQSSAAQNRLTAQQAELRRQQAALAKAIALHHRQQLKLCKFNADLARTPIPVNPATGKPSLLTVTIVSHALGAWHVLSRPR